MSIITYCLVHFDDRSILSLIIFIIHYQFSSYHLSVLSPNINMNLIIRISTVLLFGFLLTTVSHCSPDSVHYSPRRFRVNLDSPPRTRWLPVLDAFKGTDVIPRVVQRVRLFLPAKVTSPLYWIFGKLARFLPHEYAEELNGIVDHLRDQGVTLGELVVVNLLYDLFDFDRSPLGSYNSNQSWPLVPPPLGCTSILAADRHGRVLHGRNLDYGWTALLREATIVVDYSRGGQVQFTGVHFVLYTGLLTGQRAGAYTLSLNARYSGGPLDNVLMELFIRLHHPVGFELRKVLDTVPDYVGAVKRLSEVPMIAPLYIIVSGNGTGDGAIITRDRLGVTSDVYFLDYLHYRWFLVEANDDPWTESKDERKILAQKWLKQIGQDHISPDSLWSVLTKPPVKNSLTIFSTVMSTHYPDLIYNYTQVWT